LGGIVPPGKQSLHDLAGEAELERGAERQQGEQVDPAGVPCSHLGLEVLDPGGHLGCSSLLNRWWRLACQRRVRRPSRPAHQRGHPPDGTAETDHAAPARSIAVSGHVLPADRDLVGGRTRQHRQQVGVARVPVPGLGELQAPGLVAAERGEHPFGLRVGVIAQVERAIDPAQCVQPVSAGHPRDGGRKTAIPGGHGHTLPTGKVTVVRPVRPVMVTVSPVTSRASGGKNSSRQAANPMWSRFR
jgi:hypothetical protein